MLDGLLVSRQVRRAVAARHQRLGARLSRSGFGRRGGDFIDLVADRLKRRADAPAGGVVADPPSADRRIVVIIWGAAHCTAARPRSENHHREQAEPMCHDRVLGPRGPRRGKTRRRALDRPVLAGSFRQILRVVQSLTLACPAGLRSSQTRPSLGRLRGKMARSLAISATESGFAILLASTPLLLPGCGRPCARESTAGGRAGR